MINSHRGPSIDTSCRVSVHFSIFPSCFRVEDFQKSTNQKQELPVATMFVSGSRQNEQSLQKDLPQMLPTKFRFIWQSGFKGKDFQKSINQKQELPVAAIFVNGSGRNEQSLQRTSHRCILPSFGSFGKAVLEEKILQKSTNQKQESPVGAMFVSVSRRNEQSVQKTFHRCFLPCFGSFGHAVSEEKIFKHRRIRKKNCLWRPCLLTDSGEISNLYRGPSIYASYQVSVHLAKRFQR